LAYSSRQTRPGRLELEPRPPAVNRTFWWSQLTPHLLLVEEQQAPDVVEVGRRRIGEAPGLAEDRRDDDARLDERHPDPEALHLLGEGLAHRLQGVLDRRVVAVAGDGQPARDGGDVHDRAAAALAHARQHGLGNAHRMASAANEVPGGGMPRTTKGRELARRPGRESAVEVLNRRPTRGGRASA
jgi:hypothetical protein